MAEFRTVHLHGAAAIQFGGPFRFQCDTPRDALRALLRQKPGFKAFVEQADWRVIRGPIGRGMESDETMLGLRFGTVTELHLIPAASGAGRGKGIGKVVLGIALIGAALVFAPPAAGGGIALGETAIGGLGITFGSVLMTGIGLALGGVSQLLAPNPKVTGYGDREEANNRPSFLFNGPVNVSEQGNVIPIVYGRDVEVGSVVGAAGIFVEELPVT